MYKDKLRKDVSSELRWNPLTRNYSIIAPARGKRPGSFIHEPPTATPQEQGEVCPFCLGNEQHTPPEILRINKPGDNNWFTRVVPNKYPVLRIEGSLKRSSVGMYDVISGIGAHEVVIETPDCKTQFADLKPSEIELILKAWQMRCNDLLKDERFRAILLFKNHGVLAGATMHHSHSQILALPERPMTLHTLLNVARDHYASKERCIFCDIMEFEKKADERIVYEDDYFFVFCPFASASPFEIQIMPKKHAHDFCKVPEQELYAVAHILRDILERLNRTLNNPAYNLILITAPPPRKKLNRPDYWGSIHKDFHWHFMLTPRISRNAGFEWGSGCQINPVAPEDAAMHLKNITVKR